MTKIMSLSVMAAVMLASSAVFPAEVEVRNSSWRSLVEPESGVEVPGSGAVKFSVRDADQLQRMLTNVDQLNTVFQWPEGVGLSVHFGVDEDEAASSAAMAAQEASAAAAAQKAIEDAAAADAAIQAAQAASADAAERAAKATESAAAGAAQALALADAAATGVAAPTKQKAVKA